MADLQSSNTNGDCDGSDRMEEERAAKEKTSAFLKTLNDADLILFATRNGLFDAKGTQTVDHFHINVKNSFIHQTIAVENGYWSTHFRPKVESEFLAKMITAETEMNAFGLPSEMILPESIQKRGSKKHLSREEPIRKVMLEPGTYVVTLEGVSLVIDRSVIAGVSSDFKSGNEITDHVLIPMPSARIDSLFFAPKTSPPLSSNGHAHPSEDTTTEEGEIPPVLTKREEVVDEKKAETVEVKEVKEEAADDTFETVQKEEENTGANKDGNKVPIPSLASQEQKEADTLASLLPPLVPSTLQVPSNGLNGEKKDDDNDSRKGRGRSGSRKAWTDRVDEPKDLKRVSRPTRKRQGSEDREKEVKTDRVKRSKTKSGSSSEGSSSSPPPLLERQEPTAEAPATKEKRAKSTGRAAAIPLSSVVESPIPVPPTHPIISIKACPYPLNPSIVGPLQPIPPRSLSHPIPPIRFTKAPACEQRRHEDHPSTSAAPRSSFFLNGHSSIIGVKPVPQELLARRSPKNDGKKDEKLSKKEEKKKDALVKTRTQAPRVAVQKAKDAKKRQREYHSDDEREEEEEESDEEGDRGDERHRSSDEEYGDYTADASILRDEEHPSVSDTVPCTVYTINKDEMDEAKKAEDEKILKRISDENAKAQESLRRLAEQQKANETQLVQRATHDVKERKKIKDTVVKEEEMDDEEEEERTGCGASYSKRDDPMFLAMMAGGEGRNGEFFTRSLAPIYIISRDFYQSLMKPEPCLEWYARPRVGPDVDGFVYQVSGYPVFVYNSELPDLHNHREFRLGEIVWARFQREYWPGIIQGFIPADTFAEKKADVLRIQWISDKKIPEHTYLCYTDCFHFDLYFAILYHPSKADKLYPYYTAIAIAMDGRPGYWEEYISKPVFDELLSIGGNRASIPAEQLQRIERDVPAKRPTPSQIAATMAIINEKEINHFQTHYKAIYKGRNMTRFTPKLHVCDKKLGVPRNTSRKPSRKNSNASRDDSPVRSLPRIMDAPRVHHDENNRWMDNVQPEHSTIPLFSESVMEVQVKTEEPDSVEIHHLYEGASGAPIDGCIFPPQPPATGVHAGIVLDAAAIARLHEFRRQRAREEAEMNGEDDKDAVSATQNVMATAQLNEVISKLNDITSFEVLHLMDQKQQPIDIASKENDEEWMANTARCAEHILVVFENKDKRIEKSNNKYEEAKKIEAEKLADIRREKEEKAAARSIRHGTIVAPSQIKPKKQRVSKDSESSGKKDEQTDEKDKHRNNPGRPRKKKRTE